MGYRMIAAAAGVEARPLSPGRVAIDDALFKGYLANVPAADWRGRYRAQVPEQLLGSEFLARFQGTTDLATRHRSGAQLSRARRDRARDRGAPARPRVSRAARRHSGALDEPTRVRLGELMYASHASYSACGLGSDGTDQLVALVREAGPSARALRREDHGRRQRRHGRGPGRARQATRRQPDRRSLRARVGSRGRRSTPDRPMGRGHSAFAR